MHRNTNGASLVGDGARNSLANPPGGIGRKLETLGVVKLFNRANKAQVAFLDKVQEQHATAHITLGNGNYQAQVRFNELLLCIQAHLFNTRKAAAFAAFEFFTLVVGFFEGIARFNASFNLHGKVDFFRGSKQRHLADFFQVHTHWVAREQGNACVGIAAAGTHAPLPRSNARQVCGSRNGRLQFFFGNALKQVFFVAFDFVLAFSVFVGQAFRGVNVVEAHGFFRVFGFFFGFDGRQGTRVELFDFFDSFDFVLFGFPAFSSRLGCCLFSGFSRSLRGGL